MKQQGKMKKPGYIILATLLIAFIVAGCAEPEEPEPAPAPAGPKYGGVLREVSVSIPALVGWGAMVNDGREYLLSNPILSFAPGAAIMLVVFAFNMVGDGLRDALDPQLRGLL
jgi:hypothetical protein